MSDDTLHHVIRGNVPFFWNARLSRLCMPIVRGVYLVH
jgi:hypothetical protein